MGDTGVRKRRNRGVYKMETKHPASYLGTPGDHTEPGNTGKGAERGKKQNAQLRICCDQRGAGGEAP